MTHDQPDHAARAIGALGGFEHDALRWVDATCLVRGGDRVSYGELARQVDAVRSGLARLGVGQGARVALVGGQRLECVAVMLACFALGATVVVLSRVRAERSPSSLAAHTPVWFVERASLADARRACSGEARLIDLDGGRDEPDSYLGWISAHSGSPPLPPAPWQPTAVALELFGSGPGPECITHAALAARVAAARTAVPLGPDDRVLTVVPWSTAAGMTLGLWLPLFAGAPSGPVDDLAGLLQTAARRRPTVLIASTEVLIALERALSARIAGAGPAAQALFDAKLTLARERRRLAAAGRRTLALDLAHMLAARVALRPIRSALGHHLTLVVAVGSPPPPAVRERFELMGLAVVCPP